MRLGRPASIEKHCLLCRASQSRNIMAKDFRMTDMPSQLALLLEQAEHYIYLATAFILVLAAAALLTVAATETVERTVSGDYVGALLQLLDRALLVLMLAEIIYTVRG